MLDRKGNENLWLEKVKSLVIQLAKFIPGKQSNLVIINLFFKKTINITKTFFLFSYLFLILKQNSIFFFSSFSNEWVDTINLTSQEENINWNKNSKFRTNL